ncbi:MAG: hypothetical protein DME22_09530 [Verrucomicrobia bacterium]|nr:MAG: hypothetical protein DME22_09530 [Verrucomicrobiota bacterium]
MKSKSVQRRDTAPGVAGKRSKCAATPTQVPRRTQLLEPSIRLLTAVPICDGHDSAINTINLEFIRCGIEVVYLGYHRSARDIVRAATQEDVRAIGLSSYNGGHVEFFTEVVELLKRQGANDIGVFGGGGGTITKADAAIMQKKGVDRIFFAGTPLSEIVKFVKIAYNTHRRAGWRAGGETISDRRIARMLTAAETGDRDEAACFRAAPAKGIGPTTIGITGPGGAGKTTLIDELVLRFLKASPRTRLAILSHDPSLIGQGALLGDRASMVYSQDDRVFMRSLATRGQAGGLSPGSGRCLQLLKRGGFDRVFVETVGIGQEAAPFGGEPVDRVILVMSPEYGSRLQLQKIVMLDVADIVVLNKSDLSGAKTAAAEIEQRLALNGRGQKLIPTVARRHRDSGVDELFRLAIS